MLNSNRLVMNIYETDLSLCEQPQCFLYRCSTWMQITVIKTVISQRHKTCWFWREKKNQSLNDQWFYCSCLFNSVAPSAGDTKTQLIISCQLISLEPCYCMSSRFYCCFLIEKVRMLSILCTTEMNEEELSFMSLKKEYSLFFG